METEEELKEAIRKSYTRLKELAEQDESKFTDFEKSIKGKEVNSRLVKNHIIYYKKKLDRLRDNTLSKWLKNP